MIGNLFWNIWLFVGGFTFYFLLAFQDGRPAPVLIGSFLTGGFFFILAFLIRWLCKLIWITDDQTSEDSEIDHPDSIQSGDDQITQIRKKDVEENLINGEKDQSEDIAKAIQSMMKES
ncbi:hypothetical protein J2S13_000673 [Oikeobacillus pervagus]|uniref:Uncharacterized protein n=1 Tax=Oikeobacillus pervagus TaxID=1325931 RepID=A0AAJ1WFS4_9BACI|nr:hypothetical protein [Oikeobacillus pervagus]MDQ0214277.1 hypothetical protein [Oikeobacillus pervagus]